MRLRRFILASLAALVAFVSCEDLENLGLPTIKLDGDGTMAFEIAGGDQQITLTATRDWWIECDAGWLDFLPKEGKASADAQTITITAKANGDMDRTADVKFSIGMSFQTLTVTQTGPGGSLEDLTVYANDFDKELATQTYGTTGDKWPYLDQFDGWKNEKGTGIADVEYVAGGMSARNNANSDGSYSDYDGSGNNNLLFSTNNYFAIKNIALGESRNYTVSFGTEKYAGDGDNTFVPSEFHVYISADASKWVELTYTFPGEFKNGRWDLASSTFTLPADVNTLHMYFKSDLAGGHRIDDLKLLVSTAAGTAIDFSTGTDMEVGGSGGGNTGGGQEPDATAIYHNTYDKEAATKTYGSGSSWPYLDQFDGWMNAVGTGAENVTYAYKGISARNNSNSNGEHSNYAGSGVNNIFFGKDAYFATRNIALGGTTNLTLTFGTEKYSSENGSVFKNSEYHIWLSNDGGAKWVEFTDYTFAGGTTEGKWNVATANITVPSGTETLSICMAVDVASSYRMDDLKLVAAEAAGTAVDFTDAVEKDFGEGGEVTPPAGGDDPEVPVEPGEYDPQGITWTLGANAYDNTSGQNAQYGKVNGVSVANLLKLGTGSKTGDATLHVPDGTEKIGFYAVAWKGKTAEVKFSINGTELTTIKPSANDGATQNPPYTITVTDDDYFVIEMPSADAADVKVETVDPENGRVIFIKLEANPDKEAGDTPGEGGEEPEPPVVEESLMTISEVLASESALPEGSYIEAVVISNMALSNLTSKKGLYVQDATGALQFYLSANHDLSFGDKVKIDLSGVEVGEYNGAVQVSGVALEKITTISTDNAVEPKTVTVADFLANKYEGQYIAIEGVQVAESDLAKTFVEGTGDNAKHTSINVETADGKTFVIFSSKYASYGAETVPQGSGTIKGISSISKGTMQLIFAQESDYAGLTGERFGDNAGGEEPEPEPEPEASTVAEVLKSTKGDAVSTKGTVMAIHQKGYILGDATGAIYVYTNSAPTVAVGNNVALSGTFDNYFGTLQIKDAVVSANDKSTTAPSYPTPVDLTDQAAYDAFKTYGETSPVDFPYVKVKGVLSGRYITIGTSEKQSMIYYSASDYSDYDGKTVTVTGYIVGFHSSNGYYQIIETSVVADESSEGGNEGGNEGGEGENPGGEVTPPVGGASYVRVTETPSDWTGKYLIVYEDAANAYVFNGVDAVNGYASATISNNAIAASSDLTAYEVTIETMDGGYALKIGEQYISGTSGSNKLNFGSAQSLNTLTLEEDGVKVESNTSVLRFNAASNQMRFRYYKASSYTGQKAIQLYKYTE